MWTEGSRRLGRRRESVRDVPVMKEACWRKLESVGPNTHASTGMEERCAEKMQFIMPL